MPLRSLLVFVLSILAVPHLARAEPSDIAAAARGVVRIVLVGDQDGELALIGHGSGFAIGPDLVVTNAHVVAPAREMEGLRIGIVPPQGDGGSFAQIVAIAPDKDLALLRLTDRGRLPVLTLFTGTVGDGDDVYAVGYPGNVDLAQGLDVGDIVSPTTPVKTRGNVSAGRSSKQFDTILHNAAIGAGNSGGPLLDACGRVVGANTFGTISDGSDSEFYFAVSMREIVRFLRGANVSPPTSGIPCRSMAEADRAEAERLAGQNQLTAREQQAAAERSRSAQEIAQRAALFEILAERDNGLALAGLALLLALAAGGAGFACAVRGRDRDMKIAGGVAGALVIAALVAWLARPGFGDLDSRGAALADAAMTTKAGGTPRASLSGSLACTVQLDRSRVTVSSTDDISLDLTDTGCVDGRVQYARQADGWADVAVTPAGDAVVRTRLDPAQRTLVIERSYSDLATLRALREAAAKAPAAKCDAQDAAALAASRQTALASLLPPSPNERLVYSCRPGP